MRLLVKTQKADKFPSSLDKYRGYWARRGYDLKLYNHFFSFPHSGYRAHNYISFWKIQQFLSTCRGWGHYPNAGLAKDQVIHCYTKGTEEGSLRRGHMGEMQNTGWEVRLYYKKKKKFHLITILIWMIQHWIFNVTCRLGLLVLSGSVRAAWCSQLELGDRCRSPAPDRS